MRNGVSLGTPDSGTSHINCGTQPVAAGHKELCRHAAFRNDLVDGGLEVLDHRGCDSAFTIGEFDVVLWRGSQLGRNDEEAALQLQQFVMERVVGARLGTGKPQASNGFVHISICSRAG
jgi:hypothetical protein